MAAEATVSAEDLTPEEREALAQVVGSGRTEPPAPPGRGKMRDAFQYELTVDTGERDARVIVGERDVPAPLRQALARIIQESRPER